MSNSQITELLLKPGAKLITAVEVERLPQDEEKRKKALADKLDEVKAIFGKDFAKFETVYDSQAHGYVFIGLKE